MYASGFNMSPLGSPGLMGAGPFLGVTNNNTAGPSLTAEELMLEQAGLSWSALQASGGRTASACMDSTLSNISNTALPVTTRVALASALLTWQSSCFPDVREETFERCCGAMLEAIQTTLLEPDDWVTGSSYAFGAQMPALYLSQCLQIECRDSSVFLEKILGSLLFTFEYLMESGVVLREKDEFEVDNAPAIRTEAMKALTRCMAFHAIEDRSQMQGMASITVRLLEYTSPDSGSSAAAHCPLFREELLQRVLVLGTLDAALFESEVHTLLAAIRAGERDLVPIVMRNRALMHEESTMLENYLEELLDTIGIADMTDMILRLAEHEQGPLKLIHGKAVPALMREFNFCLVDYKSVVMGALIAVALTNSADPAGPAVVAPYIAQVYAVCSETPVLLAPLFKLLAVLGTAPPSSSSPSPSPSLSDSAAVASADQQLASAAAAAGAGGTGIGQKDMNVECLSYLAKISRSGLVMEPLTKAALLDAVNVVKDKCRYSRIFQSDTLRAFEAFSVHNQKAYKNIVRWNAGKSAKLGNREEFLRFGGTLQRKGAGSSAGGSVSGAASEASPASTGSKESRRSVMLKLSETLLRRKSPSSGAAGASTGGHGKIAGGGLVHHYHGLGGGPGTTSTAQSDSGPATPSTNTHQPGLYSDAGTGTGAGIGGVAGGSSIGTPFSDLKGTRLFGDAPTVDGSTETSTGTGAPHSLGSGDGSGSGGAGGSGGGWMTFAEFQAQQAQAHAPQGNGGHHQAPGSPRSASGRPPTLNLSGLGLPADAPPAVLAGVLSSSPRAQKAAEAKAEKTPIDILAPIDFSAPSTFGTTDPLAADPLAAALPAVSTQGDDISTKMRQESLKFDFSEDIRRGLIGGPCTEPLLEGENETESGTEHTQTRPPASATKSEGGSPGKRRIGLLKAAFSFRGRKRNAVQDTSIEPMHGSATVLPDPSAIPTASSNGTARASTAPIAGSNKIAPNPNFFSSNPDSGASPNPFETSIRNNRISPLPASTRLQQSMDDFSIAGGSGGQQAAAAAAPMTPEQEVAALRRRLAQLESQAATR